MTSLPPSDQSDNLSLRVAANIARYKATQKAIEQLAQLGFAVTLPDARVITEAVIGAYMASLNESVRGAR